MHIEKCDERFKEGYKQKLVGALHDSTMVYQTKYAQPLANHAVLSALPTYAQHVMIDMTFKVRM